MDKPQKISEMQKCDECNDLIVQFWKLIGPDVKADFCSITCLFQFIRKGFGNQITSFLFKRMRKV